MSQVSSKVMNSSSSHKRIISFNDGVKAKKAKIEIDYTDLSRNKEKLKVERTGLPIYNLRATLIEQIKRLKSAIIVGETGSGKTTQIPQYLIEVGLNHGAAIACTQPRRVAAITVAQRVAAEMGCELGKKVGYSVRFDDKTSPESKLIYLTDGMLLREALLDPRLKRYSAVVLDEAHERTIHTDVLFGVVKAAQRYRANGSRPLKLIIMSATLDYEEFKRYFTGAEVIWVPGRQHEVKDLFLETPRTDYDWCCILTVFKIHREAPVNEDILVFLTAAEEIENLAERIRKIFLEQPSNTPPLIVRTLYAAMPPDRQLKSLEKTPQGSRKVILATNIAETSVTISGIKFVVDSGMVKVKTFNAATGMDVLARQRISQAQAIQRAGRAGREAPGTCMRLYTEQEAAKFDENSVPEILRCCLASVILQLLAMGIEDVANFDFMTKPTPESLKVAMEQLHWLGAVDSAVPPKISAAGRKMSAFPLEPKLSKVLLSASDNQCLEEALTIVSLLSVESIVLQLAPSKRKEAEAAQSKFVAPEGDHFTLLKIYRAYKKIKDNKAWCKDNFISAKNMKMAIETRAQLREICVSQGLKLQSCGPNLALVRRCLCAGFFMNACQVQRDGTYATMSNNTPVAIHPSSVFHRDLPSCVIFNELIQTNKSYMRNLCAIEAKWLTEFAPASYKFARPLIGV